MISQQTHTHSKNLFLKLIKGTSVNLLAKVTALALGFIASLLIARSYGADTIGTIATITSFFTLAATVSLLGIDTLVLKIIPQMVDTHGLSATTKYYLKILAIVLISCIIVTSVLVIFGVDNSSTISNINPILPYALVFVAACLRINSATLRALGDYVLFSILDLLPSLLMLVIVVISLNLQLAEDIFIHVYFTGISLVCIFSFLLLRKQAIKPDAGIPAKSKTNLPTIIETIKNSAPMLGVTMSLMVIQHTDILLIGYFIDQSTVGIYSVYTKITSLVLFATLSINSMFSPTVSLLFSEGKHDELKMYAKKTTALLSIFSVTIALALFFSNGFILTLYGEEFLLDRTCLYILLLAPVIHSCFGSTGFFLNMTGGQNIFFLIMAGAAFLNLVGNLVFIPILGIHGAAISSLISIFAWNCAAMITIKKRYGYTLFFTGKKA